MKSRGHYQESRLRSGARRDGETTLINRAMSRCEPLDAIPCGVSPKTTCRSPKLRLPFDFHVPQELTKRSILYNSGQTPIPSLLIFDVLRVHRFSGASMAMGRTGSRELFLPSDGFNPTSPPQARRPERIGRPTSAFAHPLCP